MKTEEVTAKLAIFSHRGNTIPSRMWGGIARYAANGTLPGGFLRAIICNDLKDSVQQADDENVHLLAAYVSFFHCELPSACWGSHEKMRLWHESFKELSSDT